MLPTATEEPDWNKQFIKTVCKLEGKNSLESTGPHESEIRAPPQPLPYLMPIPLNMLFYNKKFITAFLSLGLGNTSQTY